MAFLDELRQRVRPVVVPLVGIFLATYFGYHAIQGERGVLTWVRLNQQIEQTARALDVSRDAEARLAHRVSLLHKSSLDRDLLDERARAVLNLARPGETVIFLPETPSAY